MYALATQISNESITLGVDPSNMFEILAGLNKREQSHEEIELSFQEPCEVQWNAVHTLVQCVVIIAHLKVWICELFAIVSHMKVL